MTLCVDVNETEHPLGKTKYIITARAIDVQHIVIDINSFLCCFSEDIDEIFGFSILQLEDIHIIIPYKSRIILEHISVE
jgi:hypothetical protein